MTGLRVLFSSHPLFAHFLPGVPLARAFVDSGHSVTAVAPQGFSLPRESGFDVLHAGLTVDEARSMLERDYPEFLGLPPEEDWKRAMPLMGGCFAPRLMSDLADLFATAPPDLVLCDGVELASQYLAGKHGIPAAIYGFGGRYRPELAEMGLQMLEPVWAAKGLDVSILRDLRGHDSTAKILFCPPSLQVAEVPPGTMFVRPPAGDLVPTEGLASAVGDFDDRPLVYVGMGTIWNTDELLGTAVQAALDADVNVVCTVGPGEDPSAFGMTHERLHLVDFAALGWLLPRCAAAIHHGGAGTMGTCFAAGCPQVLLPRGTDHFMNAECVSDAGCGLVIPPQGAERAAITAALRVVLEDRAYSRAAARIRDEVHTMLSPAEAVDQVVACLG